jgi:hypothetical protein
MSLKSIYDNKIGIYDGILGVGKGAITTTETFYEAASLESFKTFVDYNFKNNNDNSGRNKSLSYLGTGSTYLYTEPTTNIPYALVPSGLLSGIIGNTTSGGGIIVNSTVDAGTGMIISFQLKLNFMTGLNFTNQYIFAIGNQLSTPQTIESSVATTGITFRFDSATAITFLLTYNNAYSSYNTINYTFSYTDWTKITFVINKNLISSKIAYTAYVNDIVNITNTWIGVTNPTSLDIGNNTGNAFNNITFYGSAFSPKIANFKIWRSDDISVITKNHIGYCAPLLLSNNNIVMIPNNASNVNLYNIASNSIINSIALSGYSGGIVRSNGTVVLSPYNASTIQILNNTGLTTTSVSASGGYIGSVITSTGSIVFIPASSPNVRLLTSANVTSTITPTFGSIVDIVSTTINGLLPTSWYRGLLTNVATGANLAGGNLINTLFTVTDETLSQLPCFISSTTSASLASSSVIGTTFPSVISISMGVYISENSLNSWESYELATIATNANPLNSTNFRVAINSSKNLILFTGLDNASSSAYNFLPFYDKWTHIIAIYDNSKVSTSNQFLLYINGILQTPISKTSQNTEVEIGSTGVNMYIGNWGGSTFNTPVLARYSEILLFIGTIPSISILYKSYKDANDLKNKYYGGVILSNQKIVFVPNSATQIGIFTLPDTFALSMAVIPNSELYDKYRGGILLPNGKIIFIPSSAAYIGIYDPVLDAFQNGPSATGYASGKLLSDNRILLVPDIATRVAIYDYRNNSISYSSINISGYNESVILPNKSLLFTSNTATKIAIYTPKDILIYPDERYTNIIGPLGSGYEGEVLLQNGDIVFIPNSSKMILTYTPSTNSIIRTVLGISYIGGILISDGRVILIPSIENKEIAIYNPSDATLTYGPIPSAVFIYRSGVLLENNTILLIPFSGTNVRIGIYTPNTTVGSVDTTTGQLASGYYGGVLMKNKKVLLIPNTATTSGLYDTVTQTITQTITDPIATNCSGFIGGVLLQNGCVLLIPNTATRVGIYDPVSNRLRLGASATGYANGKNLPDGRVIMFPDTALQIAIYNPTSDSVLYQSVATGFRGGTVLPNGKVILTPYTNTNINIFTPTKLFSSDGYTVFEGSLAVKNTNILSTANAQFSKTTKNDFLNWVQGISNARKDCWWCSPPTKLIPTLSLVNNITTLYNYTNDLTGSLNSLNIYTSASGSYALERLFNEYTGPSVRLRRADNDMIDAWFNKNGYIYKYMNVASGIFYNTSESLNTWVGASTIYIVIWYDQSSATEHITLSSTDNSMPLFEYDATLANNGYGLKL